MTTTSDHVELVTELVRLLETRILDPLEILLASDDLLGPIRARLRVEAEVWAAQLLGPDRERATLTAVRIIAVLFPGDGPSTRPRRGGAPRWDGPWPARPVTPPWRPCPTPRRERCSASPGRGSPT